MRACPCGVSFAPKHRKHLYCSERCRDRRWDRANRAKLRQRWRAAGGCSECGEPCGRFAKCFGCRKRHAKSNRLWWTRNRALTPTKRLCPCGVTYTANRRDKAHCTTTCWQRFYRQRRNQKVAA